MSAYQSHRASLSFGDVFTHRTGRRPWTWHFDSLLETQPRVAPSLHPGLYQQPTLTGYRTP